MQDRRPNTDIKIHRFLCFFTRMANFGQQSTPTKNQSFFAAILYGAYYLKIYGPLRTQTMVTEKHYHRSVPCYYTPTSLQCSRHERKTNVTDLPDIKLSSIGYGMKISTSFGCFENKYQTESKILLKT